MNKINEKFQKAYQLHVSGNLIEAEKIYEEILIRDKKNYQVLALLGGIKINNNLTLDVGITLLKKSIKLAPSLHFPYIFYGTALMKKNNFEEAKNQLIIAKRKSNQMNIDINFNLAICESKLGNIDESIKLYEEILEKKLDFTPALINLGNLFFRIKEYRKSEIIYLKINNLRKNFDVLKYLGNINLKLKNYEKAQKYLDDAKKINEDFEIKIIQLHLHLARNEIEKVVNGLLDFKETEIYEIFKIKILLHKSTNNLIEAKNLINDYISKNRYPKHELLIELARIFLLEKDYNSAIDCLKKDPTESNEKNSVYALIYDELNNDNEAKKYYVKALKGNDPETKLNYGLWLFKRKEFESGSKYLIDLNNDDLFSLNNGTKKITDTVILYGDQGIGDQIIYSKFIHYFINKNIKINLYVDHRLTELFKENFTNINIHKITDFHPKNLDKKIILFMSSLPVYLASQIENYQKYFFSKIPKVKSIKYKKNKLLIGLSWHSYNQKFGKEKSIPVKHINNLVENSVHYEFINLQYGNIERDLDILSKNNNFEPLINLDKKNNINELLDVINQCDFVVTCSNVTAHYCGILNKKCYLLVPFSKGNLWFWHNHESKSSWYESIEILKQESYENWDDVFSKLNLKLSL